MASFFLFVVYPRFHSPWGLAGLQTAAYAVLVAPVVVLRPTLHADGRPQRRRLWNASGAVVLAAAVVITAASGLSAAAVARDVTKYLATGVVEEVLFRGVLWCLLARRIARPALLVAADVALFVAWHVPSVLAGDSSGQGLWVVGALGVVFALARLASGRIGLPALLHVAVDLLGSS